MIGLRLDSEARLRGGAAACGAARSAAAGAQREVLWRRSCCWRTGRPARPRPRCPAEAAAPSPCRGPGRRLRRLRVPRPTLPLPLRQLPPWQPSLQQPLPPWVRGLLLLLVPKAPPTPSAATATSPSSAATAAVSSIACAAPRTTSCARCPASSRRRSTSSGRPMICGGGCGCGPGRGNIEADVLGCVLGELGAEGLRRREPCCSCAHEVRCCLRSVGRAAQTARDGGRALSVVRQRVGLGVSCEVVLAKAVSSALAHPGQVLVRGVGVRKPSSGIALRGVCCRGCGLGSSLDCTKSSK